MSHASSISYKFFGSYLLHKGLVTQEQLDDALRLQEESNRRIGELAVEKGLLTPEQVNEIFIEQKQIDAPFGTIALRKKFMRRDDLDDLLFSQAVLSTHIGEALLLQGYLSPEQFGSELREFKKQEQEQQETLDALEIAPREKAAADVLVSSFKRAYLRFAKQEVKLDLSIQNSELDRFSFCFELTADLGQTGQLVASFLLSASFPETIAVNTIEPTGAWREAAISNCREFFSIVGHYITHEWEVPEQPIKDVAVRGGLLENMPPLQQGVFIGLHASNERILLHIRLATVSE